MTTSRILRASLVLILAAGVLTVAQPAAAWKSDCQYYGTDLGEAFKKTGNTTYSGTAATIHMDWPELCGDEDNDDNRGHIAVGMEKPGTGYTRSGLWSVGGDSEDDWYYAVWKESSGEAERIIVADPDDYANEDYFHWTQDINDAACSSANDQCIIMGFGYILLVKTSIDQYAVWGGDYDLSLTYGARNTFEASDIPGYSGSESAIQGLVAHNGSSWVANPNTFSSTISISRYHLGTNYLNSFLVWTDPA